MSKLNADHGMTIITATHDPMVMAHAGRQVHLLDGHIDRNEQRAGRFPQQLLVAALSVVTAQVVWADEYAIVVGSYADQGNAERAQTSAETQLRQRGINAPVRLLAANGRTRVPGRHGTKPPATAATIATAQIP